MDIWHVDNRDPRSIRLWRRTDGSFQVVEDGNYTPILNNGNYLLIHQKYGKAFEGFEDQVNFKSAHIIDTQLETECYDYLEMLIPNLIDTDSIDSMDSSGFKVWRHHYSGALFISDSLKLLISDLSEGDIIFSEGFERFG